MNSLVRFANQVYGNSSCPERDVADIAYENARAADAARASYR